MASFVLYNASVTINSVDLSDHVRSCTIDASQALQDDTAMGDTFQSNAAGLLGASITVEFLQDYATSKVDQTIGPLLSISQAAFPVAIRPDASASASTTNPNYNCSCVLESYNPIAGSVGDQAMASATFAPTSALTRGT